jgi:predicted transcriptional regulator
MEEPSTRDLHERVGAPQGLAYTTVAKVLDRLHAKGLVRRERRGRVHVYHPAVPQDEVERLRAQAAVTKLFGNAPQPAMAGLVDAVEAVDPALLDELARAVAKRRRSRRES